MNLIETINKDYLTAFKNKETVRKNLLWEIKTEIVLLSKEKEVVDADVFNIIQKQLKKIQATIDTCPESHKAVLEQANEEKTILTQYLPKQLTEEEITSIIKDQLSWKNIWETMSFFKQNYSGRVDMKLISQIYNNINS